MSKTSETSETTVDLSSRKRVGPEAESREDQFDGNELDAVEPAAAGPLPGDETAGGRHGIDRSNDLTTP